MEYDQTYKTSDEYFGSRPDPILEHYCGLLEAPGPVLDVGAGQGRNALFLARRGFSVDAIDPSQVAVETTAKAAAKEGVRIRAIHSSFETFLPDRAPYAGILLFGLIQILSREEIGLLKEKTWAWARDGSLVFATAFTTEDPSFRRCQREWTPVGKNSFSKEPGIVRTFLEKDEILSIYDGYTVVHHWEGRGPEHRHGNGPVERHGWVDCVLRRGAEDGIRDAR
jgi:SAM-dependent methyltransferase